VNKCGTILGCIHTERNVQQTLVSGLLVPLRDAHLDTVLPGLGFRAVLCCSSKIVLFLLYSLTDNDRDSDVYLSKFISRKIRCFQALWFLDHL